MRSKVKKEKNVRSKVKRKTSVVASHPREAVPQLLRTDGTGTGGGMVGMVVDLW